MELHVKHVNYEHSTSMELHVKHVNYEHSTSMELHVMWNYVGKNKQ
jgi:hypothetical protein